MSVRPEESARSPTLADLRRAVAQEHQARIDAARAQIDRVLQETGTALDYQARIVVTDDGRLVVERAVRLIVVSDPILSAAQGNPETGLPSVPTPTGPP